MEKLNCLRSLQMCSKRTNLSSSATGSTINGYLNIVYVDVTWLRIGPSFLYTLQEMVKINLHLRHQNNTQ